MSDEATPGEGLVARIARHTIKALSEIEGVDFAAIVLVGDDGDSLSFVHDTGPDGASLRERMVGHYGLTQLARQIAEGVSAHTLRFEPKREDPEDPDTEKVN